MGSHIVWTLPLVSWEKNGVSHCVDFALSKLCVDTVI